MADFSELRKKKKKVISEINNQVDNLKILSEDAERVAKISKNANIIIKNLDVEFERAVKLKNFDINFLFFAIALQCIRQYVIGCLTERSDDQTAASNTMGHHEEHSDRKHRWYRPSIDEIRSNPVPFDAIYGSKEQGLNIGGGFNHRAKTLGHDPLLGWIFGTANISTSTVTLSEGLKSYHILTGYTKNGYARDRICNPANTYKVLKYSMNNLLNQGNDGKEKMGISLIKEAVHLKSDLYSIVSLPVPIISTFSIDKARKLAEFGIDAGNVIKVSSQATFAILINSLIGMIHGLFYDESRDGSWNTYSIRTRKILTYSNVIASSSNIIAVAFGSIIGLATKNKKLIKKSLNFLDIGGIIVTLYRLVNDKKFIQSIKKETLEKEFYNIVMGNLKLKEN